MEKRRPATVDEFQRIADALPPQMYWMWQMLGLTGMRISAACTLLESDITDRFFTVTTKGNKRVEYPMSPALREVIQGARQWKAEKGFTPPTLFCSHRGRPWKHYTFSEQLRRYSGDLHITPHQLRHMAGTIMAENNLSADIIQASLGHEHRVSSEQYIDQTSKMRYKALSVVAKNLHCKCKKSRTMSDNEGQPKTIRTNERQEATCPCCGCKLLVIQ
ncbi:MAG: site-specific integrase [Planctomycetaceae bacterium]|nr:site-specific integrase [Planctomycetaceae bacterium]